MVKKFIPLGTHAYLAVCFDQGIINLKSIDA